MAKKTKKQAKTNLVLSTDKYIAGLGLKPTNQPDQSKTQMPDDPTRLNPKLLGRAYTRMVGWHSYSNEALARVEVELIEAEYELRKAKAIYRMSAKSSMPKWQVEDSMYESRPMHRLMLRVNKLSARKMALQAIVLNYDNKAKCLSRELTRRGFEMGNAGRA